MNDLLAVRAALKAEVQRREDGDRHERTDGVKAGDDGEEGAETRQPDLLTSIMTCSPITKPFAWTSLPISRGHDPLIRPVHASSRLGCKCISYNSQAVRGKIDVKLSDLASSHSARQSQLSCHTDRHGVLAPSQDVWSSSTGHSPGLLVACTKARRMSVPLSDRRHATSTTGGCSCVGRVRPPTAQM